MHNVLACRLYLNYLDNDIICKHAHIDIFQILMSVCWECMTVAGMLFVLTLLGATTVCVNKTTLGMEELV